MNIEYTTINYGNHVIIIYSVCVRRKDDGAHFPYFDYNGFLGLMGEDAEKSDDELYDMVLTHFKEHCKDKNGISFDELLEDPAFESISISVKKETFYDKSIKITK